MKGFGSQNDGSDSSSSYDEDDAQVTMEDVEIDASNNHADATSMLDKTQTLPAPHDRNFFHINQWIRVANVSSKFHGAIGQVRATRQNRCHVVNVYVKISEDTYSRFKSTFVPESCVPVDEEVALAILGESFKPRLKRKYGVSVYDGKDESLTERSANAESSLMVGEGHIDSLPPIPEKSPRSFFAKLQWVKIISPTSSYVGCIGQVRTIWKDKMQYVDIYVDHGEGRFRISKNTLIPESLEAIAEEDAREILGASFPDPKPLRPSKKERRIRNSMLSNLSMPSAGGDSTGMMQIALQGNSSKSVQFYPKYQWVRVMAPSSSYFGCIGQIRGIEKGKAHGVLVYKEEAPGFYIIIRNSLAPQSLAPIPVEEAQEILGTSFPKVTSVEYVTTESIAVDDVVQVIDENSPYYGRIGRVQTIQEDGKVGQAQLYIKHVNGLFQAIDAIIRAEEVLMLNLDEAQQCLQSTIVYGSTSTSGSPEDFISDYLSMEDIIRSFNPFRQANIKRRKSLIANGCLPHLTSPLSSSNPPEEVDVVPVDLSNDTSMEAEAVFSKYQWVLINSTEKSKYDGCVGQVRGVKESGRQYVNAYVKENGEFVVHQCNLIPKSMKLISDDEAMAVLGDYYPEIKVKRRNTVFSEVDMLVKGQWVRISNATSRYCGNIAQVRGNTSVGSHIIVIYIPVRDEAADAADVLSQGPSKPFETKTTSLVPQSLTKISVNEAREVLGLAFPSDAKTRSFSYSHLRPDSVMPSDRSESLVRLADEL
jgi:hypothetical protein